MTYEVILAADLSVLMDLPNNQTNNRKIIFWLIRKCAMHAEALTQGPR